MPNVPRTLDVLDATEAACDREQVMQKCLASEPNIAATMATEAELAVLRWTDRSEC